MPQQLRDINSESLREIGVLFIVFGPLEGLLKSTSLHAVDFAIALSIASFGGVLLVVGTRMGMNPLVALPFAVPVIVPVVLIWTGFRDKRSSELKAEAQLKSARQLLVEVLKLEEKREAEASARK
jgi:hypothetical protein